MNKLNDKRVYAIDYPKTNIVISSVMSNLDKKITNVELENILENLLKQQKDDVINIAINLSPNVLVGKTIWDKLSNIIKKQNNLLLIPIISIIGAKQDAVFHPNFDTVAIKELINSVLSKSIDIDIFPSLITNLQNKKLSNLYKLQSQLDNIDIKKELSIKKGQTILLNYIVIKFNSLINHDIIDTNKYNQIKNKIAQILNDSPNLTVYTIPYEPLDILTAINMGNIHYNDINLHIKLSDTIKIIRQSNKTPKITINMVDNTINIIIHDGTNTHSLNWELSLIDDFNLIVSKIEDLIIDLQVDYAIQE